jgi:hypothetical protein
MAIIEQGYYSLLKSYREEVIAELEQLLASRTGKENLKVDVILSVSNVEVQEMPAESTTLDTKRTSWLQFHDGEGISLFSKPIEVKTGGTGQ